MNAHVSFNRDFAEFTSKVRPFERADEVGYVISELMWYNGAPYYPANALMDAAISSVWLGEGEPKSEDTIDLILRFEASFDGAPQNYHLFEIILRGEGPAYYGGYVAGSYFHATDEIVNGHRVIETELGGDVTRWVYEPHGGNGPGQYRFQQILGTPTTASIRQRGKRRRSAR